MDAITAMNNFSQTIMAGAQMIQANKSSKADRKMVQRENEKSRKWNAEMWQKQNEYNPAYYLITYINIYLFPYYV